MFILYRFLELKDFGAYKSRRSPRNPASEKRLDASIDVFRLLARLCRVNTVVKI